MDSGDDADSASGDESDPPWHVGDESSDEDNSVGDEPYTSLSGDEASSNDSDSSADGPPAKTEYANCLECGLALAIKFFKPGTELDDPWVQCDYCQLYQCQKHLISKLQNHCISPKNSFYCKVCAKAMYSVRKDDSAKEQKEIEEYYQTYCT